MTLTLDVWGEFSGFGGGVHIDNLGFWSIQAGSDWVVGSASEADSLWLTPNGLAFRDQITLTIGVTDGQVIPLQAALLWVCSTETGENCSFDVGNTAWLRISSPDGVSFTSASGELLSDPYVPEALARLDQLAIDVESVGPGRSLRDKIASAQTYFAIPDINATCSTLRAFGNEVRAQSGKTIAADLASRLIGDAERARGAVGCQ